MSDEHRRDGISVSVAPREGVATLQEAVERPFQVLVVGDFSGRDAGARGAADPVEERRPVRVDSIEEAMERIRPAVELPSAGGGSATLEPRSLDDFHPDRLIARHPGLRALVAGIDEVVSGLPRSSDPDVPRPPEPGSRRPAEPPGPPPSGLLDEIVADRTAGEQAAGSGALDELRPWIREIVEPHLRPEAPHGEARVRTRLEAEAAVEVRAVLHHPAVRALERSWGGLLHLLRAVAAVPDSRLFLLDLARSELAAVTGSGDPREGGLLRTVSEPLGAGAGATPAGVVVGDWMVGPSASDLLLLNRLAVLASVAGVPWLLGAQPGLLEWGSFDDVSPGSSGADEPGGVWDAFRATEAAHSVALFAPGFLVRVPYGAGGEPCETLPFEEVAAGEPGAYLWASSAFLAAAALVEAFGRSGWTLDVGSPHDFSSMPFHASESDSVGAHSVQRLLDTEGAARTRELGVNPVLGYRGEARIRLPGIRSPARPEGRLDRWWSG